MKKIYKVFPTGGFSPTLEYFGKYHFYITGKYYDYAGNEDKFENAEVFMVWDPVEMEYGKFIPNRYIGLIKNMGFYETKYLPETDEMTFLQKEVLMWQPLNADEIERLLEVTLNQCHWQKQTNVWNTGIENLYIEVWHPNSLWQDMLLKQKILHELPICFDNDGKIQNINFIEKRFYITNEICYDFQNHCFIKNNEEIFFTPYNADLKQKFLETLMAASPKKVQKEELFRILWFSGNDANKKLLELKRSLVKFEFEKYLWLSRDFVEDNILLSVKNQWHSILPCQE